MGFCVVMLSAVLISSGANAVDKTPDQNIYALQYEFGTASDLVVEPNWQNIPEDASAKLKHIATELGASKQFANIGGEWSPAITSGLIFRGSTPVLRVYKRGYGKRVCSWRV
jgi:hypothetical protein